LRAFLRATLAGGLLFLLPLVLVAVLGGHAIAFARKVVVPLAQAVHVDARIGPTEETIVAVLLLVLIAMSAGLIARSRAGKAIVAWTEQTFLGSLPQYQFVKSMTAGLAQLEGDAGMTPVLVDVGEGWKIGYQIEPVGNGWVTVFLPRAPSPTSGEVLYLPAARIRHVDLTLVQAMTIMKHLGIGSAAALRGTQFARTGDPEHRSNP
jgi:uncharacterized membrane protein